VVVVLVVVVVSLVVVVVPVPGLGLVPVAAYAAANVLASAPYLLFTAVNVPLTVRTPPVNDARLPFFAVNMAASAAVGAKSAARVLRANPARAKPRRAGRGLRQRTVSAKAAVAAARARNSPPLWTVTARTPNP
jgi:hypothetical protein